MPDFSNRSQTWNVKLTALHTVRLLSIWIISMDEFSYSLSCSLSGACASAFVMTSSLYAMSSPEISTPSTIHYIKVDVWWIVCLAASYFLILTRDTSFFSSQLLTPPDARIFFLFAFLFLTSCPSCARYTVLLAHQHIRQWLPAVFTFLPCLPILLLSSTVRCLTSHTFS